MLSHRIILSILFFCAGALALAGFGKSYQAVGASIMRGEQFKQSEKEAREPLKTTAKRDFGDLPLYFAANRGQVGDDVKYYSGGSGYGLFLTQNGAILRLVSGKAEASETAQIEKTGNLKTGEVRLNFIGANLSAAFEGEEELPGKVNYFIGSDDSRWQRNVSTFAKIRYKSIYPGIDAVFYGNQRELEYDFVVAPNADPSRIGLSFEGAEKVFINKNGELVIKLQNGEILQRKPVAYQNFNGQRREIAARFAKRGNRIVFHLGKYDTNKELVIDPIIVFSTFFGGNNSETASSVKTDAQGNIYLTGGTYSTNFPTVNPQQPAHGGNFAFDAFVTKINPAGNSVIYSTYLGGANEDYAASINIDGEGNAVIAGRTSSPNFPTANAVQTQIGGAADGFIAKLKSDGSALTYSTFLGGSAFDEILSAAFDGSGNPVVVGRTESGNFPVTNAFQAARAGVSLFRSSNSGDSWTNGVMPPSVSQISAFAVNPSSPNTVYAGTNAGVFRSHDGGTVWAAAGQNDLKTPVSKIVVARSNPNVIYAISFTTVYKSTNGGDSWTSLSGNVFSIFNTLAVDPNNADIVYGGGSNGSVYKTVNGGTSWTNVSPTNNFSSVNSLAVDASNSQIVYAGTSQQILKSTTGGGNWQVMNGGIPFSTTFNDLLFDSATNTIYAASQIGLFKSANGGLAWAQINVNGLMTVRSLAQDRSNPAKLYAVTGSGAVFRSFDSGASWNQSGSFQSNLLYALAVTSNSILFGTYSGTDAFVARLNAAGNAITYSTFFGGTGSDAATSVRIDAAGKISFVGVTNSADFPIANAVQPAIGGGNDAFVAKLNENGAALSYSTFLGGTATDAATSLAIDHDGNTLITGNTVSVNFPVQNALQQTCASCTSSFSNDVFVTKLNAEGSARIYSTFLGGSATDTATSIEVDFQNRAFVVGTTSSNNFPVLDAVQQSFGGISDGFVSQIKPDGSNFVYSTYFGGSSNDAISSVVVSPDGNAVVVGSTASQFNFPRVRPIQEVFGGGQDVFIAKIGVDADLEISLTDERDPVMINSSLTYNLRVKNNGPSAATNVVVTDALPTGTDLVSVIPTQGICTANDATLTCSLGNLASNAQVGIRLVLKTTQTGTINNTATVRGSEPDSVSANNSDSEQTGISSLPSIFGRITAQNGEPASNVSVRVEGLQNKTVQTNAAGTYLAAEMAFAGNYTVRPLKTGFYFSPRSKSFSSLTRDETADFVISPCSYTLSTSSASFSAAASSQDIFITANDPFCDWTATSNASWISITNGASGFGNGTVRISIQAASVPRTGTLTIAGQTFTVTQSGCSFTLMPFQQSFGQTGGTGTITVTANQGFCQWTAETTDSWITITNNASGTGNETITYTIAPAATPRKGRIIVGGVPFAVYQESNFCAAPSFATPLETTINGDSLDIVAADFNNDGKPDIATIDETPGQIWAFSVYLGSGDGTFSKTTRTTNVVNLTSIIAADFNRDSKTDIALAGNGRILIYNGDGSGGFALSTTIESGSGFFTEIFAEDFNRDGKTDLLLGAGNGLFFYRGNGDGTFTAGANYPINGRATYSYAIGDLNGDGATDMVVGNEQDFNIPRLIYFFGSSDGTFTQAGTFSTGALTPFAVKIGDFNGDGRGDVVMSGYGASQVQVLLWNPMTNSFRTPSRVFTEPNSANVFEIADMDNDGKLDIVTTSNQPYPQRLNVLRGNGNGTFRSVIGFKTVWYINAIAFADFNRDGKIDLAYAKENNQYAVQISQCGSAAALATRRTTTKFDFDGDQKADFSVIRSSENIWYIHRVGNQPLLAERFGTNGDISVPADYDGDGRTDIAVFRPADGYWYRLNSSNGQFYAEKWGKAGDIPVPADFDGDERADLAVFRPSEKVWYWVGSLNGQIHSTQFGLSEDIPVVGDYDGDGKADIAVFRPSNGYWFRLNSSDGIFQAFQFGTSQDKVVPGDYDGDGKTDVAVFRPSVNTWYLMKSSVNQFFAIKFGNKDDTPVPADYDGDGKTDFAIFKNGNWNLLESRSGAVATIQFGVTTDKPVPSVFIP